MVNNPIDIGDKVYVGGLFGIDFIDINNKFGRVEKIVFASTKFYATYIADVMVDGEIFPVNLVYLFKFSDNVGINHHIHFSGSPSDPLNFYYRKLNLVGTPKLGVDEMGRSLLFCKSREGNVQALNLTSLN